MAPATASTHVTATATATTLDRLVTGYWKKLRGLVHGVVRARWLSTLDPEQCIFAYIREPKRHRFATVTVTSEVFANTTLSVAGYAGAFTEAVG